MPAKGSCQKNNSRQRYTQKNKHMHYQHKDLCPLTITNVLSLIQRKPIKIKLVYIAQKKNRWSFTCETSSQTIIPKCPWWPETKGIYPWWQTGLPLQTNGRVKSPNRHKYSRITRRSNISKVPLKEWIIFKYSSEWRQNVRGSRVDFVHVSKHKVVYLI